MYSAVPRSSLTAEKAQAKVRMIRT
jgi:hypothetical protein